MLADLFYFLKGYVIIQITGDSPEKFINIALARKIALWDIQRIGDGRMTMRMTVRGFRKIRGVPKKCGCKVTILAKKGLPFEKKRHKKRTALLYGVLLFLAAVLVMSSFLWQVEITGCERIPEDELRTQLTACGLSPGKPLFSLQTPVISQKMMAKNPDISWIGINLKGTKAFVEIVETVPVPQMVREDEACNFVSDKTGVIESMTVKYGEPVVQVGDAVTEGQLLVSGLLNSNMVGMRTTHADAEVWVRTWHEKQCSVSLVRHERPATGEKKTRYQIVLGSFGMNLYFSDAVPYENYDIGTDVFTWNGLGFPIQWIRVQNIEVAPKDVPLSEQEAFETACAQLTAEIEGELTEGGRILEVEKEYTPLGEEILVHITAQALEQTGEKVPIAQADTEEKP